MTNTQPFFTTNLPGYFGGKAASGTVHKIINLIPKHQFFISGFLGNCAIMRYKQPAKYNVGMDISPNVVQAWENCLRNNHHLDVGQRNFITTDLESFGKETVCYLDPPYLLKTRTSRNRYEYELTEKEHEQLLQKIRLLTCNVAISCYDNPLYKMMLYDWDKIHFTSQTRGGPREETLYFNYDRPEPHELHDPRFLGTDFRAREKSTRRIKTILGKIDRLTPEEQARIKEHLTLKF